MVQGTIYYTRVQGTSEKVQGTGYKEHQNVQYTVQNAVKTQGMRYNVQCAVCCTRYKVQYKEHCEVQGTMSNLSKALFTA